MGPFPILPMTSPPANPWRFPFHCSRPLAHNFLLIPHPDNCAQGRFLALIRSSSWQGVAIRSFLPNSTLHFPSLLCHSPRPLYKNVLFFFPRNFRRISGGLPSPGTENRFSLSRFLPSMGLFFSQPTFGIQSSTFNPPPQSTRIMGVTRRSPHELFHGSFLKRQVSPLLHVWRRVYFPSDVSL